MFHNVNTEAGWSGTPLMRQLKGRLVMTAVHIAGCPGKMPYNMAVSAPFLEHLLPLEHGHLLVQGLHNHSSIPSLLGRDYP